MSCVAAGGWAVAALALALQLVSRRRWHGRLAAIAEAEHELRGPLTALSLALDIEASGRRAVPRAALQMEVARAGRALADLTAARTGTRLGGPSLVAIDLGRVVRDSFAAWQPAADAAGVDLSHVGPHTVPALGDPVRIAQATGNLIANAIEHGGGRVQVRASTADGQARIEVADGGPGIADHVARQAARRGRASTRGHGLRVAARVAAQHGGALAVRPARARDGQDSSAVVLTLPLRSSR